MKYKQIWKTAASCLVAALMFPSCSDDEGGGGDVQDDRYRTLMITLNSLGNQEVGTRAETADPGAGDDSQDEHFISRYWLVVLKQKVAEDETTSFVVDRVIDSEDPEYIIPDNTKPNSETEIGVEVEIGQTYRFYALANLDGLEKGDEIIDKLNKLQPGDPFDPTKYNVTVKEMSEYPKDGTSYIPMSSYGYDQYIKADTKELSESIALIRLIGKITVEITNLTGTDYTVNSLTMNGMRKGEIFLFPYDVDDYDKDDKPVRCLFLKEMIENYRPSFPTDGRAYDQPFTIAEEDKEIPKGTEDKVIAVQYVPETSWKGNADLEITADISTRGEQSKPIFTSFIRRNDWLTIPLQISPFDATFTFSQEHMPIGGLPEKITLNANEAVIPIIDRTTDHAGKITVDFTVSVAGSSSVITDPVLVTEKQVAAGVNYSKISKVKNDSKVLLEDRNELNIDGTSMSGSLELTLQEMSKASTAEVEVLFVVASKSAIANGQGGKLGPYDTSIAVPYTIRLTYDNPKN